MRSTSDLQQDYGLRFESLIERAGDRKMQRIVMDELALQAERAGLIDSAASLRRSSVEDFVADLWLDNPAIYDRLSLSRETLPPPNAVKDLATALDVLQ